jgi:hypothetical protein
MMFCQVAEAKSLREIIDGLACCECKLRQLGFEGLTEAFHPVLMLILWSWKFYPVPQGSNVTKGQLICLS